MAEVGRTGSDAYRSHGKPASQVNAAIYGNRAEASAQVMEASVEVVQAFIESSIYLNGK